MALTTEQETKGMMDEKPRNPKEPILNKPMKRWMTAIFLITGLDAFLFFILFWKFTGDLDKTRTVVFVFICVASLILAFSVRSFQRTIFRKDIFSNHYLVGGVAIGFILLLGSIYLPPLQKLLVTQPLGAIEWLLIFSVGLFEISLIEFSKVKIFKQSA